MPSAKASLFCFVPPPSSRVGTHPAVCRGTPSSVLRGPAALGSLACKAFAAPSPAPVCVLLKGAFPVMYELEACQRSATRASCYAGAGDFLSEGRTSAGSPGNQASRLGKESTGVWMGASSSGWEEGKRLLHGERRISGTSQSRGRQAQETTRPP